MNSVLALCVLGTLLALQTRAADGPPVAPVRPVTDNYHGVAVADPYRYMENFADPVVQAWVKGQAEFAKRTLESIPGRDALLARIRELDAGAPYRIHVLRRWPNGDLHYYKTLASENLEKLYFRDAKTGAERLLIDPEALPNPPGGGHYALSFAVPSPDNRYVAYGLAASGSEQTVLHLLETATGKNLPETIDRVESDYTWPNWLADSSGFVYSRRQKLAPGAPATEGYKRTSAHLHRLRTDVAADAPVLATDDRVATMAETDFPSIVLAPGSRFAVAKIKHGDANELTLYAAPADALGKANVPWRKVCDVEHGVEDFAVRGDDVYLLSGQGAPRYKVVRTSLAAPDFAQAEVVVPAGENVIKAIEAARDGLYVNVLEAGLGRVARLPYERGAALQPVALPEGASSAYAFAADPEIDGALVSTESWTRAGRIYRFDPATNALADTQLRPRGAFDDPAGYESHEVLVASHDGVKVPLSIVHKAGLKLDGSHPTLVNGYGAYGSVLAVRFNPVNLAWLERGGVLAFAHVRGGGEFGKAWHLGGKEATKPNTWKDFIACGEYLVQQGYTSPANLAGQGGSAGGILIGRAVTERPDLFAAAIFQVGCLDALRMETTTNGVPNIAEFGTVTNLAGFKALYEMSAFHHVTDGRKYPAVLLVHGINDPRVEPWQSAKMVARLQAATASGKPILFRVDYEAGHGIGSTKRQRQEQAADQWAFLLWQTGETGFQKTP